MMSRGRQVASDGSVALLQPVACAVRDDEDLAGIGRGREEDTERREMEQTDLDGHVPFVVLESPQSRADGRICVRDSRSLADDSVSRGP